MSTSNDSLWVLIAMAFDSAPNAREGAAAVLRVIADEVVPEEDPPSGNDRGCAVTWGKWHQRMQFRRRLLNEGLRAEVGRES